MKITAFESLCQQAIDSTITHIQNQKFENQGNQSTNLNDFEQKKQKQITNLTELKTVIAYIMKKTPNYSSTERLIFLLSSLACWLQNHQYKYQDDLSHLSAINPSKLLFPNLVSIATQQHTNQAVDPSCITHPDMLAFLFKPEVLDAMQLIHVKQGAMQLKTFDEINVQKTNLLHKVLYKKNQGYHGIAFYFQSLLSKHLPKDTLTKQNARMEYQDEVKNFITSKTTLSSDTNKSIAYSIMALLSNSHICTEKLPVLGKLSYFVRKKIVENYLNQAENLIEKNASHIQNSNPVAIAMRDEAQGIIQQQRKPFLASPIQSIQTGFIQLTQQVSAWLNSNLKNHFGKTSETSDRGDWPVTTTSIEMDTLYVNTNSSTDDHSSMTTPTEPSSNKYDASSPTPSSPIQSHR